MTTALHDTIDSVRRGVRLDVAGARAATALMLDEDADPREVADLLVVLAERGHDAATVAGAVLAIRAGATPVRWHWPAVDVVGTGGIGSQRVNISTASALLAAAAGATVAKTGNRAATSRCGSADVLEALGMTIDDVDLVPIQLRDLGFGFVCSATVHQAVARLAPLRRSLGIRTLFNLAGPLASPLNLSGRLVGVADPAEQLVMADAAALLGLRRTWLVHGHGGLDELTTTGPNRVLEVDGAAPRELVLDPAELGLPPSPPSDLQGGDAADNARLLGELFDGAGTTGLRDTCLLNAAVVVHLAGLATDLPTALELVRSALHSGAAGRLTRSLGALTPSLPVFDDGALSRAS